MAKTENDLDIYYAVGNANTFRQETEIGEIIKKIYLSITIVFLNY